MSHVRSLPRVRFDRVLGRGALVNIAIGLVGLLLGAIGLVRVVTTTARYARRAYVAGNRAIAERNARVAHAKRVAAKAERDSDPRRLNAAALLMLAEAIAALAQQAKEAQRRGRS